MAEYASKGVAGSGLGLGIAGTALGLLNANGGGGLLGGLLGGGWNNQAAQMANAAGMNALAEKDSIIAQLKSEKYADQVGIQVYQQSATDNRNLRENILGDWVKPLAQEAAANRERIAVLETQVQCDREKAVLREQILTQKIDCASREAAHGIANVGAGLASLRHTVDSLTRTIIPHSSICPPVMPRWNAWEAPTNVAPDTQPINGTVNIAE